MIPEKISLKKSKLMWELLRFNLMIIGIMFLIILYNSNLLTLLQRETDKNLQELRELRAVGNNIAAMTVAARSYYETEDPQYQTIFQDTYQPVAAELNTLTQQYPKTYVFRDLTAMTDSFYQDGLDFFASLQNRNSEKIYYRDTLLAMERLKQSIDETLLLALENRLSLAQDHSQIAANNINHTRLIMWLVVVGITLFCLLFSIRFSKRTAEPIYKMSCKFFEVAHGDLSVREQTLHPKDDVSILIYAFNHMMDRLQKADKESRAQAKVQQQLQAERIKNVEMNHLLEKSRLEYLHMQINPHFLFNTFNSISALAQYENAFQTQAMVDSLACLLRYHLSTADHTIPLRDEVQIIGSYLYIQETRFGKRITHEITIPEELLDQSIPAMILQPLVENAVIHGLEPLSEGGTVKIEAKRTDHHLLLSVSDDGQGMTSSQLSELKQKIADAPLAKSGIGLTNVSKRLQLLYGSKVMTISSEIGVGTCIQIELPI